MKENIIYFFVEYKPYNIPLRFKRVNTTKKEILKEFPNAFNIQEV